ncbi:MAG: branched-chain amino acid transaminase [Candidatus Acidiferrales bacterium]
MGFEQARWVWMNGSIVPWDQATFHVSSHALHYGSGVFEGIRCYDTVRGPAIFRLPEHLERLFNSAKFYDLKIPYTIEQLDAAICEVVRRNQFRGCYVRPICFYGSATLGVHPRNCPVQSAILAWPWDSFLKADGEHTGVRVCISPWRKFHSTMMPTTAKACGQYINSILAVQDAQRRGFDEALLLDKNESLAEGSGENLFVVKNGRIITNDSRHSILMGVTRDAVIQIARDLGVSVDARDLQMDDLTTADEAFFTGTAVEVAPIQELEGKPIGPVFPGPVTRQIRSVFRAASSGQDARYARWLRPVNA